MYMRYMQSEFCAHETCWASQPRNIDIDRDEQSIFQAEALGKRQRCWEEVQKG
ncbi:hypothetical protein LX36DRAFT_650481 [Colletotrichum falcatum]|nr:hypothetical protein LX36DRAFT_650481 [Colletotrichum falcatum]